MRADTLLYWVCLALVGAEVAYGLYWAIPDIGMRLGLWPRALHPDLAELLPALGLWQEIVFFSHVALGIAALIALARHWAGCIPLFVLAFVFDRVDWIIMGTIPLSDYQNASIADWVSAISEFGGIGLMAILQLIAIMLLTILYQRNQLRMSVTSA